MMRFKSRSNFAKSLRPLLPQSSGSNRTNFSTHGKVKPKTKTTSASPFLNFWIEQLYRLPITLHWPVKADKLWLEQFEDDPRVLLHDEAGLRHLVGHLLAVVVLHVELELDRFVLFVGVRTGQKKNRLKFFIAIILVLTSKIFDRWF